MSESTPAHDRRVLASGLAALAGGIAGAAVVGSAGAGIWYALTLPHEGLEGLGAIVVVMLAGLIGSYPGMLLGVWLAVRGRPAAGSTVAFAAIGYPVAATLTVLGYMGLGAPLPLVMQMITVVAMLGVGWWSRALALRGHSPRVASAVSDG